MSLDKQTLLAIALTHNMTVDALSRELRTVTDLLKQNSGTAPVHYHRGHPIYEVAVGPGANASRYLVHVIDGEIAYFVEHTPVSAFRFSAGRQVMVVRVDVTHPATRRLALAVMFDILIPRYGSIVSDDIQTRDGARLWSNAIERAFATNHNVYFIDWRSRGPAPELTRIEDDKHLTALQKVIWGSTLDHNRTWLAISKKRLSAAGS